MNVSKTNKRAIIGFIFAFSILFLLGFPSSATELPRPTYNNSFIFSFIYNITKAPSSETEYIKSQFGNGLYAPLTFTTFSGVEMDWHWNVSKADNGIPKFKTFIDSAVTESKKYGVGLHLVLNYGGSRSVDIYDPAKTEDIRNAQWYNDNNITSQTQMEVHELNEYVYTTFSRYARKLRKHIESAVLAAFKYLKKIQDQNPDLVITVSAPGEAELNALRINGGTIQEFFCDYSPFAVLEFRDWITHQGEYGSGGKYNGQGYENGGTRYQGDTGLENFNHDFGTAFTSWDLKYYHWSLSDPQDSTYTDTINPDPNIIPFNDYSFGAMKPQSGAHYIAGGFDPPRIMKEKGEDPFCDLFQDFREWMVHHYIYDMAQIVRTSGFAKDHYFSHQIPADYLWGTRPNDPEVPLNERYYASASPLWTAKTFSDVGMGITMYDINFISHYARTSLYAVPAISSMATNWGAFEYNPEVVVTNTLNDINTADSIVEQIQRLYDYHAHAIGFYSWDGNPDVRFGGTNRELAAKQFFDTIKDKARQAVTTVFTPPAVNGFIGTYDLKSDGVTLSWSSKIWSDLKYLWSNWGDFKTFIIYRGYSPDFTCNANTQIGQATSFTYTDRNFYKSGKVYYKITAANVNDATGPVASISVSVPITGTPVLTVSKNALILGKTIGGPCSAPQLFRITNTGNAPMNWTVQKNVDWITCTPTSGLDNGTVIVTVNAAHKTAGTYTGSITINAGNATGSPKTVSVTLRVIDAETDAAPFGAFEVPSGNDPVQGSIPLCGWALDDIGIESVKIYRKDGTKSVFIDNAVFIDGVRPDLAAAYNTYPGNTRAGWGYMLLTNFLPGNGNGTFEFVAVARDVSGHETVIGTKTITCDNAHAVKPFGTIDTPAQGGTVSGSSYVVFGWALTPQPNTIPLDGSTIDVFIDDVNVGHPVYNNYREDIALSFPKYFNSAGAVGYFILDATKYAEGIHTISWRVTDSGGNTDGIGSRYFYVNGEHRIGDYR
ncbi:MAG: BACON domain-containing protein [Candidatus Omnitrophota bacterium]